MGHLRLDYRSGSAAMTLDVYAHVLPGMQREATERLGAVLFGAPR
jgi:hypothetical protein